jgi:hypothetical protein
MMVSSIALSLTSTFPPIIIHNFFLLSTRAVLGSALPTEVPSQEGGISHKDEYGVWVIALIMAQKLSSGVSNWT